jgi:hypothetical protein
MTSVLILITHWADDYWYKSGEAPYTKYLDDVPNFIGDKNFRAIGIYSKGKLKEEHVDKTNLSPAFLKVTRIGGNKDRLTIEYKYHGDKIEMPSKLLLDEIQKLPKHKSESFLPLCFFLTNEEWKQVEGNLNITPHVPNWWRDIEAISEPKAESHKFSVESFRSKFKTGAYRTKYGLMVRSRMEVIISDFLMDNGIVVQYEPLLLLNGSELYPDFYIPSLDIYIEYWGSEEEDYMRKRQQKEALYQKHSVHYISLDESDAAFIHDSLKQKLSPYLPGKTDWR